jgi:hypothetical protein
MKNAAPAALQRTGSLHTHAEPANAESISPSPPAVEKHRFVWVWPGDLAKAACPAQAFRVEMPRYFLSAHVEQENRRVCACLSHLVGSMTLDSAWRADRWAYKFSTIPQPGTFKKTIWKHHSQLLASLLGVACSERKGLPRCARNPANNAVLRG